MVAKRSNTKSSAAAAAVAAPTQNAKAPAVAAPAAKEEAPEQSETEDESDAPPADDESGEEEGEGADSGDETHSEAGGGDDDGLDLDVDAPEGDDNDDDEEEELDAVGFGDAMSKILGQNVAEDAQPILAKRTTQRMREIMAEKKVTKTARISAAEKREKEQKDMIIPDHSTVVQDRRLRTIATKGVVALFNAIEKHQHQNGKKSDEKNDKKVKEMSKDNFLGLLKASQKSVTESAAATAAPASKSLWSVVQDDFMMGAKLKDWDATHGTEKGRARNHDDDEIEAAEDAAWKQVGDLDSDDEGAKAASSSSAKRKNAKGSSDRKPAGKKAKRS